MSDKNARSAELLAELPPRYREILSQLAELDMRDDWNELLWLIEAVGMGRFKDLGDDARAPRVHAPPRADSGNERVRVRAFRSGQPPIDPRAEPQ
jgi:hypothetical protein